MVDLGKSLQRRQEMSVKRNRAGLISLVLCGVLIVALAEGAALLRIAWLDTAPSPDELPAAVSDAKKEAVEPDVIHLSEERAKEAGVRCESAHGGKIADFLRLTGEVKLNDDKTIIVTTPVSGIVRSVEASLGDTKQAGALLVTLSSSDVASARATLEAAQSRAALAEKSFAREKRLWERQISAQQDFLAAQQTFQEAQIAVREAQQRLKVLGVEASARGEDFSVLSIVAPITGSVVEKNVVAGANVDAGAALLKLSSLDALWIDLDVRQEALAQVQVGQQVLLGATAVPTERQAMVTYIGPVVGTDSRTARARLVIDNADGFWRAGQFAYGFVPLEAMEVPVLVPEAAVQTVSGAPTVFVQSQEGYVPRVVKLGRTGDHVVELRSGVEPGECVVVEGSFVLKAELSKATASHDDE